MHVDDVIEIASFLDSPSRFCKRQARLNVLSTTSSRMKRQNSKRASPSPPRSPASSYIHQISFEKECNALQKQSKLYLDGIRGVSAATTSKITCTNAPHLQFCAPFFVGMASAQSRIADTIEVFYTASDRTSEGALAANAYKRAVEDLDHSIMRELARAPSLRENVP